MSEKARFWTGVLYPENMIDNWQDELENKLQIPYAYCIHDKDIDENGEERKVHAHIDLVFPNTTTYNHAFSILDALSKPGFHCLNKIERIINIRYAYDYLIHDTEKCKKQGKHLYSKSERIVGNNFDIGAYEQLSITDKNKMTKELCDVIINNCCTNFADFYVYVINNFDDSYFEILRTYSGLFERIIKGVYHRTSDTNEANK